MQDKQACKEWYIRRKVRQVMSIPGDPGLTLKAALLSGLCLDELEYVYNHQVCGQALCECEKLHVFRKESGLAIISINWIRKCKNCYFSIMPTRLWDSFRGMISFNASDIRNACKVANSVADIDAAGLRRIFYSVISEAMGVCEIQVLNGKASFNDAMDCMTQLDSLAEKYCRAWEKFGIILPVLY